MKTQEPTLHVGSRKHFNTKEILLLEANENYTKIHLASGKIFISSTTLGKIEKRLANNPHFFRTHKTFMVNLNHVTNINQSDLQITNGLNISLSRRKRNRLQEILQKQ